MQVRIEPTTLINTLCGAHCSEYCVITWHWKRHLISPPQIYSFKVKVNWYGKLRIFSGKTLVLLHLRYLEFVHWIENGCNKKITKISSEKNRIFEAKVSFILLEKSLLEFFQVSFSLAYLEITYELPWPLKSYDTSSTLVMFILYLD